jgi:nitric oxide reductase NorE protein
MTHQSSSKEPYPPGDFAIWLIIYIELLTFGLFFVGYAFSRRQDIALFNESQLLLNQTSGLIDMLLLLTSSYFMVKAANAIKYTNDTLTANRIVRRWLLATMLFGVLFLFNKSAELSVLFDQGISLNTNRFFMFYLLLSLFHLMHVALGCVIVFNVYQSAKQNRYSSADYRGVETAAMYWHLVDLLWIVLFALFYVLR